METLVSAERSSPPRERSSSSPKAPRLAPGKVGWRVSPLLQLGDENLDDQVLERQLRLLGPPLGNPGHGEAGLVSMLRRRRVRTGSRQDRGQVLEEAPRVAADTPASRLQFRRHDVELALEESPDIGQGDLRALARVPARPELAHGNRFQIAGQLGLQQSLNVLLVQGHPERAYRCQDLIA